VDGTQKITGKNALFYWLPGQALRGGKDTDIVPLSLQHDHTLVMDHMLARMNGGD